MKRPFEHFTPARWRGTTYPTNCFREDVQQVVALSFDTPNGTMTTKYEGTVEGDTLKGTTLREGGPGEPRPFEAKKQ